VLDLFAVLYQFVCFPLYGIAPVPQINCAYCSYANGLASFVKEVVGRTEQYWCPIKHARRVLQAHPYYVGFVDYGDAQAYREQLQNLRAGLSERRSAQAGSWAARQRTTPQRPRRANR
jgi:hypothetical protein